MPSKTFTLSKRGVQSKTFSFSTGSTYAPVRTALFTEEAYAPLRIASFTDTDGGGETVLALGAVSLPITQVVAYGLETVSTPLLQEGVAIGAPIAAKLAINVYEAGDVTTFLQQKVTELIATLSASIGSSVYETGLLSTAVTQNLFGTTSSEGTTPSGTAIPDGLLFSPLDPILWSCKVVLKGVDVSVSLTGVVSVDIEEMSARVASFTLNPTAGLVDLSSWVMSTVSIIFKKTDNQGGTVSEHLLFSGFVDVPTYDPQTRLTTFTCSDLLQNAFESSSVDAIAFSTGGFWSANVFTEETDKWSYALDRMSTIPYSLEFDVNRVIVKTPWLAKDTPDFTFNAAVIVDGSLSVSLASSRDLVNVVDLSFNYNYDAFKERSAKYRWKMKPDVATFASVYHATPVAFHQVLQAADTGGWVHQTTPLFTPWPPSGAYDGALIQNADREIVVGASLKMVKRYKQAVSETYLITLSSPKSVASLGELKDSSGYSVGVEYSDGIADFEATTDSNSSYVATLNTYFAESVVSDVPVNPTFIGRTDVAFTYTSYLHQYSSQTVGEDSVLDLTSYIIENSRASLEVDIATAQNQSKTAILASHRKNFVTATVSLEPSVTPQNTVKIDTPSVLAKGKVSQVTHELDIDAGTAFSGVTIAVSLSTAVGITDTLTPLSAETEPAEIVAPQESSQGNIFSSGDNLGNWLEAEPFANRTGKNQYGMQAYRDRTEFLVNFPEIAQADVDEIELTKGSVFIVDIPDEELILNA